MSGTTIMIHEQIDNVTGSSFEGSHFPERQINTLKINAGNEQVTFFFDSEESLKEFCEIHNFEVE